MTDKRLFRRFLYSVDIVWIFVTAAIVPMLVYGFFALYPINLWILFLAGIFVLLVSWSIKRNKERLRFYKELEDTFGFEPPKFLSILPKGYLGVYKNFNVRYWSYDWGDSSIRRHGAKISIQGNKKSSGRLLAHLWLDPFHDISTNSMVFSFKVDDRLKPYVTKELILNHFRPLGSLLHSVVIFENGTKIIRLRKEILAMDQIKQILDLLIDFRVDRIN